MGQHWSRYIEDFENEDNRDYVRSKKHRKKKLNHKQEKQMKEAKRNGTKYPKKRKR